MEDKLTTEQPAGKSPLPVEKPNFDSWRAHSRLPLLMSMKEGAGLEHCPSANFSTNSAWLQCAVLVHDLIRWTATIGAPVEALTVARSVRTRLIALDGTDHKDH